MFRVYISHTLIYLKARRLGFPHCTYNDMNPNFLSLLFVLSLAIPVISQTPPPGYVQSGSAGWTDLAVQWQVLIILAGGSGLVVLLFLIWANRGTIYKLMGRSESANTKAFYQPVTPYDHLDEGMPRKIIVANIERI